jgi:hypothetical protein
MDNNLVIPIVVNFYKFAYRIWLIHKFISSGNIGKINGIQVIDGNYKDDDDFLLLYVIMKYHG